MTANGKQAVVLDVMGADGGPETIVAGGLEAAARHGENIKVIFVGNEAQINEILSANDNLPKNIEVQHAESEVPMSISATDGVRMRDSSIAVGLRLIKEGRADAFVSPGNTGAVMATSLLTLGRIEGVHRPAITAIFPTSTGKPCVVLDVGANADCRPMHLEQFAVMGSLYSSNVFKQEAPRVGLISIGEERSKGNDLIFQARRLLADAPVNFIGHVEGRDILSGVVDVAVTDGFTGNILLKFAESLQPMLVRAVQRQIQTNIFSRVGVILMLPFLKRMRSTFDYAESGGAPLLGVDGIVIICHGSSSSRAIANAVKVAAGMAETKMNKRIHEKLQNHHQRKPNEPATTG